MKQPQRTIRPYRFGILVDTSGPRRWELWCAQHLVEAHEGAPCFVGILDLGKREAESHGPRDRAANYIRKLYGRWFSRLESFRKVPTDQLAQVLAKGKSRIEILRDLSPDTPEQYERIRKLDLDFILGFSESDCLNSYRDMARLGVWWFSDVHGNARSLERLFLDSMLKRKHRVEVALRNHSDQQPSPGLLWRGCYGIDQNAPGEHFERVVRDLAHWPLWTSRRLHHGYHHVSEEASPDDSANRGSRVPMGTALTWPVKLLWGKFTRKATNVFLRPQWNIAILQRPIHTLLEKPVTEDARFLDIDPRAAFRADPFGVSEDGVLTILFEEFDYDRAKGIIAFLQVTDDVQGYPRTVFDDLHHLSYPFVFEDAGTLYCVPESGRAGKIKIHRAVHFPEAWETVAQVGNSLSGVDSTVFRHGGLWWLACTLMEHEPNTNLFLYYADSLSGPWHPHRGNPVKSDVRSSRPAGTPFVYRGELYRPSQDCSQKYGGRVCINRILRLEPDEFVEEEVCIIEPVPGSGYPDGLHTISSVGDRTLIDGLRHTFTWQGMVRFFQRKCRMSNIATKSLRREQSPVGTENDTLSQ